MTDPAPARAEAPEPQGLERLVVARAAAVALLIAMPAAMANVVLAAQDPKPAAALNATLLLLLVGFLLGGLTAGSEAHHLATKHGAAAAVVAFVPVQVVGILGRLDRGDSIAPIGIIMLGLLAACAGTLGAQLGARRRARRENR